MHIYVHVQEETIATVENDRRSFFHKASSKKISSQQNFNSMSIESVVQTMKYGNVPVFHHG